MIIVDNLLWNFALGKPAKNILTMCDGNPIRHRCEGMSAPIASVTKIIVASLASKSNTHVTLS